MEFLTGEVVVSTVAVVDLSTVAVVDLSTVAVVVDPLPRVSLSYDTLMPSLELLSKRQTLQLKPV